MPFAKKRRAPEPEMGEGMAALPSDRWRSFCLHYLLEAPHYGAATRAARAAGFGTPTSRPVVMARYAHRLMQDPRIQRALMEESKKLLRAHAPEAVNALLAIVRDVRHKDHVRGVQLLLDRTDSVELHSTVHHQVEINHTDEALRELAFLKKHGVDRAALEEMFGYSGLSRYEAMLAERDAPKRVAAREQPEPAGPVIEAEAVEVKPAVVPKDSGLPGDRW